MKIISYDLGTGGVKASLHNEQMETLTKSFIEYPTFYPQSYMHEQKPEDWWHGVINSTKHLLEKTGVDPLEVACVALSGASCVAIPLDKNLELIDETVPIWSDTRAVEDVADFFTRIDEETWYMTTGNGFPASCYSLFKLMWFKKHFPEKYARTYKVCGSKDYINLKMTGKLLMDYSYASSTGAYDLKTKKMRKDFLDAAGISDDLYPDIVPSHTIVGNLTPEAAEALGLHTGVKVACGGVDNACMALGAVGSQDGAAYVSLGSSSWIPMNSHEPILDFKTHPYVFAHIEEDMFTSAYSIFAGGSSYQWCRDQLCRDCNGEDAYKRMDEMAATVPIGSGGIIFNPSLAGGTSQDKSINIRGGFLGLHLGTTREALIRATLEGITLNLKNSLDHLAEKATLSDHILICGGGSKSKFWMQMFADVFNMDIIKTNVDQNAASLGAAAICARALGLWKDYTEIPKLHQIQHKCSPVAEAHEKYCKILEAFNHISDILCDLGDYMIARQ